MLYLITGTLFIDGRGEIPIRKIVDASDQVEATMQAEIEAAGKDFDHIMWWLDDYNIKPLPEDQAMIRLEIEGIVQRLPGLENNG